MLPNGIYSRILNERLKNLLQTSGVMGRTEFAQCDHILLAKLFAQELSEEIRKKLEDLLLEESASDNVLHDYVHSPSFLTLLDHLLPIEAKLLKEIKTVATAKPIKIDSQAEWLTASSLFAPDGHAPELGAELEKELACCDRAEWLVSFIKLSAVRRFYPILQRFCSRPAPDGGPRLRIATTTYMGASDTKALKLLLELDNTEIRVSFDSQSTRLHAKAYLFYRESGFSSAYVGSANLSLPAMGKGLEWTVKLTQWEMPALWQQARSAFLRSWRDEEKFKRCTLNDIERIEEALLHERQRGNKGQQLTFDFQIRPHGYQEVVLDALAKERSAGRHRHLLVAATGTGKTMVAVFDFLRQKRNELKREPTLLYIAHRTDILTQARLKYRLVTRNETFGMLLPKDDITSDRTNAIFCTPQTWSSQIKDKWPHGFDCIVLDECHHAAAASQREIVEYYAQNIDAGKSDLLGLTATPMREDGVDIRPLFGGSFSHELSLSFAINEGHLVPFTYFAILDETVDFTNIRWQRRSSEIQVQKLIEHNLKRAENVLREAEKYVPDLLDMRGLGFCAGVEHAKFMTDFFNKHNIPSICLHGSSSAEERRIAVMRLNDATENRINMIFTADLFNEGVDLPNVDTLFMLRPTNSLAIFTQQLGRGLRKPDVGFSKHSLLVLDFVTRQNETYDDTMRFKAMSTETRFPIKRQIEAGMPFVPAGCSVTLTERAREVVLKNMETRMRKMRGSCIVEQILEFIRNIGKRPTLEALLENIGLETPTDLYARTATIPSLLVSSALSAEKQNISAKEQQHMAKFLLQLCQNNDHKLISKWLHELQSNSPIISDMERFAFATCWAYRDTKKEDVDKIWQQIKSSSGLFTDVGELLQWLLSKTLPTTEETSGPGFLRLHCRYSRTQIMAALGKPGYLPQGGVEKSADKKTVALFVTRNKSLSLFSPSTMYRDYATSPSTFKWDSPNSTRATSQLAKDLYSGDITPLLFMQREKQTEHGIPESFIYLGSLTHMSHCNECPIEFEWKLQTPMPAEVFEWAQ